MELQEIEVFIAPDGQVRIEVHGVTGTACLDLTRGLEQALGNQLEARTMRPEACEVPRQPAHDQLRLGHGGS